MRARVNAVAAVLASLTAISLCAARAEPYAPPAAYNDVLAGLNSDAEHLRWRRCFDIALPAEDRAVACQRIISDGESDYPALYVALGDADMDLGAPNEAIEAYSGAVDMMGDRRASWERRAVAYAENGNYEKALADLHVAMTIKGPAAQVYNVSCWLHAVARRDLEQGLADCQAALARNPDNADALDSRGFLYFRAGQLNDAKVSYAAAIAADPKLASALYMRGVIARLQGAPAGTDIAAALAIDAQVAERYSRYGIKPQAP
jgi:tetratricopeptide (TPR) repeat protein